jgi:diacylglycerol kinase family enzyme
MMTISQRRIVVVLNTGSGGGAAEAARDVLRPIFSDAGIATDYVMLDGDTDLRAALDEALTTPADGVVAGGGDGTVNSVADAIRGRGVALGVLPLGTLNHFARDLGIPQELAAAAAVIADGHTIPVDAGEVNGRIFLNNSSVGLYARIVSLRERYHARGPAKWLVATWATMNVLRRSRPLVVRIKVDGREVIRRTPLIFIGNNEYRMEGLQAGSRESLTGGSLALYVVKTDGQWRLLRLAWRVVVGTARQSGELAMVAVSEAMIDVPAGGNRQTVSVAIDGEVTAVDFPLEYRSLPVMFQVFVPR